MKLITITLTALLSLSSQAATWGGENCGLFDTTEDMTENHPAHVTAKKSVWDANGLSEQEKAKVVQVVSWNLEESVDFSKAIEDFTEIEGFVATLKQPHRNLIYVGYFPGDNEYGLIFEEGTQQPLASVSDTDVACF